MDICDTTTARFRTVHRLIRLAQQTGQRVGIFWIECKADAGGAGQFLPLDVVGLLECLGQPFGEFFSDFRIDIRNKCDKLVAARATYDVAGPEAPPESGCGDLEKLVANLVPTLVVDSFELVQVDKQERAGRIVGTSR